MNVDPANIRAALSREFATLEFARDEFPMLTRWGVKDESTCIHSLGFNYLAALGRRLGFWAATEYAIRVERSFIRPDVVWWSRPEGHVALIGEFERFETGQNAKLVEKSKNLMLSYEALGRTPPALLLMPWTFAGTDLSSTYLARGVAHDGFRADDGRLIHGVGKDATFLLARAIFGETGGLVRLLEVQL